MIERFLFGLALIAPAAAPAEPPAQEVVVRSSAARPAIERILNADNLDVDRLSAREVADTMADIPRGRAPTEFWNAYQAHVQAWLDYADAREAGRGNDPTDIDRKPDGRAIADARQRINSTFQKVERIARLHRARLPASPTRF